MTRPESKWIEFRLLAVQPASRKTQRWFVVTKDTAGCLGVVQWFGRWRRYSFFPAEGTVYESTCLRDIAAFCDWLMAERKAAR